MSKPLTQTEMAKMGGVARAQKYPEEIRKQWSGRSGEALKKKYGDDYFIKMANERERRKKEKRNEKPKKKSIRQLFGIK